MDPATDASTAERRRRRVPALLWVLGFIVVARLLTLGAYPLFDKTEARYALIGELMLRTGNWITPLIDVGVPFWAKPPLSTWATALSYATFGVNAFAARFSPFLFVAGAGVLVYLLGAATRGRRTGLLAACIFASSGLTFYLAGGVMTDPALLLGTTLTMAAYWRSLQAPSPAWGYLFFIGLGISLLAKGPIGVVLPGLAIGAFVLWHNAWLRTWRALPWISGTLLTLLIAAPWYWLAEQSTPGFLRYFIVGEHFERFLVKDWQGDLYGGPRRHPYGTIWLFGFLAALPWSLLLPAALFRPRLRRAVFDRQILRDDWLRYLLLWNLTPLLFFTLPRAVLITYVAMGLPGFALLAAHVLREAGLDRHRLVPFSAALVPAAAVAAVLAMRLDPVAARLPTQAGVVALYEARRTGPDYELFYIWEKPFSAAFYSEGRARLAKDPDAAVRALRQGAQPYFAVARTQFDRLPALLRDRLDLVAERNGTMLLRPAARQDAAADAATAGRP